jgi:iron complex outermembrane receptor protein
MDSEIKEFDDEIFNRMESELLARTANSVKLPEGTQRAFDNQFEGEHLPNFAHQTANVFLQHELPVGKKTIITRVDYSHFGDRYWWLDGQDVQESVNLMDSSISLMVTDDLEFQLWCKNCLDTEYDSEYAPTEKELFGGAAKDVAYRARGITWGVKAKYHF